MALDYKAIYDAEFEQREHLRSALSTPIGLLTLLGGLIGYTSQHVRLDAAPPAVLFFSAAGLASILIGVATYHLIRAMHGHEYKQLKPATTLREYHQELREWHRSNGNGPLAGDREFDDYLEVSFAEAADHNQRINRIRSEYLFLCNRWLIRAVVAEAVLLVVFGVVVQLQATARGAADDQTRPPFPEQVTHGQPTPHAVGAPGRASAEAQPAAARQPPRGTHPSPGASPVTR